MFFLWRWLNLWKELFLYFTLLCFTFCQFTVGLEYCKINKLAFLICTNPAEIRLCVVLHVYLYFASYFAHLNVLCLSIICLNVKTLFSRFVVLYFNLCSFYMFYERLTSPQAADNPTSSTLEVMGITVEVMHKLNLHCTEILLTPAVLNWLRFTSAA